MRKKEVVGGEGGGTSMITGGMGAAGECGNKRLTERVIIVLPGYY